MTKKLLTFLAVIAAVGFSSVQASNDDLTLNSDESAKTAAVCAKPEAWDAWAALVESTVQDGDANALLSLFSTMAERLTPPEGLAAMTESNPHTDLITKLTEATEETAIRIATELLCMFPRPLAITTVVSVENPVAPEPAGTDTTGDKAPPLASPRDKTPDGDKPTSPKDETTAIE